MERLVWEAPAAKILPSPFHKPDALRACSCLTYLQSSLPSPWSPHPHLTQPVVAPTSLFEEERFLPSAMVLALLYNSHITSPPPQSTFWPCLLVQFSCSCFFSCSFCSSMVCLKIPASKPDAQLYFQEILACVSDKYSRWMLYFSCEGPASHHKNTCVNGDMWIAVT